MDFHSLSRKELQTLCKQNKIPANITNIAMADALSALHKVEGLEEFINSVESDNQKSPEKLMPECPNIPKTACRTTTRRKQVDVESLSVVSTRRTTRRSVAVEADQENKNVNQLVTPAAPVTRTRRKATAATSARQRSVAAEEKSMQRGGGTRQSVRLLEKSLGEMSLKEEGKVEPVKFDVSESNKVSDEIEDEIGGLEDFSSQNQLLNNRNDDEDKLPEDNKENEYEMENCSVKLDFDGDDNPGNPSGFDAKDEVEDNNFNKHNKIEAGPSTGESNETLSDAMKSEMANEVSNNDVLLVIEMAKNVETAASPDEEFSSPNEIKESLNLQGFVGDESEINSIQDDQHGNLEVFDCKQLEQVQENETQESVQEFSSPNEIKESLNLQGLVGDESETNSIQDDQQGNLEVGFDCKQLEQVQENETQESVQEQVSHPSETVLCEKLASETEPEDPKLDHEHEECHQVSNDVVMEKEENNESFFECDAITHEELSECSIEAELKVTQVSVKSTKANLEETIVLENAVSETSDNLEKIPEEEMIVSSIFECPSTLNNPTSKATSEMVSSPFALATLQGQFPRPTVSAPVTSLTKKDSALPTVNDVSDIDDEENIHMSGKKLEPKKDEVNIMADEEMLETLSLRQLTRMVKELQISKKNKEEKNANKAGKARLPLQRLQENRMATTESGNEF